MTEPFKTFGQKLALFEGDPRPTEDPLWLSAFIPPLPQGARVLDVGTGSGLAILSLLLRQPHIVAEAMDINPTHTEWARNNAALNHLPLTVHTANILQNPPSGPYDAILCNPPYHGQERGHTTANPLKKQAHSLPQGHLTLWLESMNNLLTPTGTLHLILHSACEAELTTFAQTHQKILHLTPLQTAENKSPKRLLVLLEPASTPTVHHHTAIPAYNPQTRNAHLA